MSEQTSVVVIGGGYAGVMAANRLTQRDDVAVTLINPRRTFVERIRLHQLAGGSDDAVVDYGKILAGGVELVVDTVTRIDAAGRRVSLDSGGAVGYDYLIYAVGSGTADRRVPGAAEFAYPIASLEDAEACARHSRICRSRLRCPWSAPDRLASRPRRSWPRWAATWSWSAAARSARTCILGVGARLPGSWRSSV
jgi:NADH dehydrogenase FAD-containing subunit